MGTMNANEASETITDLEKKRAVPDLKRESEAPSATGPRPSTVPSYFKNELGIRRISPRPINIITSTDQDILHFKEENFGLGKQRPDELLAIPILPADEMDSLTSEIKLWNTNVKCVRMIFCGGFIVALSLVVIGVTFSLYWFMEPDAFTELPYRNGTTNYNFHMCGHFLNILLLLIGSMLFRVLPHTEMKKVIWMHAIIFQLGFILCIGANYISFVFHKVFTASSTDFYSLHSWIGILAFVLYFISLVTGWMFLYYPTGTLRAHHSIYGKITFGIILIAALMGYYERTVEYSDKVSESVTTSLPVGWINTIGVLLFFLSIVVRVGLANFGFRRQPKPQWDVIVFRSIQEIEEIFVEVHDNFDSFELWVKQVNFTKMGVLQTAYRENQDDEDEDAERKED